MLTPFFVPINFHKCRPREWKRSYENVFNYNRLQLMENKKCQKDDES